MNQSGRFTLRFPLLAALLLLWTPPAARAQTSIAPSDQFTAPAPVMTFMDMNTGQPWGRYVMSETVTVPKYEYREVKERVWVPTWVQEPRPTTATQYEQVVSWQLRPRSIPSWNPFTPPQQILEYVPIVQYQPRNVQAMQMTTYQKYEEREISRMVPMMVNASEQRAKFVDRPLTSPPSAGPMASNIVQESAMVAQASRTSARYPTRSIDYPSAPYGSPTYAYTSPTVAWNAPQTMVPSPANTMATSGTATTPASYAFASAPPANTASPSNAPPSSIVVGNGVTYSSTLVPVPSAWVASNPSVVNAPGSVPMPSVPTNPTVAVPPSSSPPNMYAANPYAPNPYAPNPYAGTPYGAAPSTSPYTSWLYSTGSLYSSNMFQTSPASAMPMASAATVPNSTVYASNAPNFWGRTAPTTMPPAWGTYPPMVSASGPTGYR